MTESPSPRPKQQSVARWIILAGYAAGLAGIACVIGFRFCFTLAPVHWIFDALTSFACYAALAGLVGATLSIASRSRILIPVAVTVGLWGTVPIAREWGDSTGQPRGPSALKVVSANVYSGNRDADAVGAMIRNESPDVIALLEADDFWASALPEINAEYKYRIKQTDLGNFGFDIRSRIPLENAEVFQFSENSTPSVRADVALDDGTHVHLIMTHTVPPRNTRYWQSRNEQLAAISQATAGLDAPVLVVGDLNITPWSPFFQDFKRNGQLQDARHTTPGISPTWNAMTYWLRIPIDYALTKNLAVVDYHIGANIGSDHFPVSVTVRP